MMLHLYTNDFEKFLHALGTLAERGGAWTVAASVYSTGGHFNLIKVGCRAAAWLPLGREVVIYDESREVMSGHPDAQAAERDAIDHVSAVESYAKKHNIRWLPMLFDYHPGLGQKGGAK